MKKKITFQRSFGKGCANSAILSCVHVPASAPAFKVLHTHGKTQNKPAKSTSQAAEKPQPDKNERDRIPAISFLNNLNLIP